MEGNTQKVILKYNNNEYYYVYIHFYLCCTGGTDSFIQLNSNLKQLIFLLLLCSIIYFNFFKIKN